MTSWLKSDCEYKNLTANPLMKALSLHFNSKRSWLYIDYNDISWNHIIKRKNNYP